MLHAYIFCPISLLFSMDTYITYTLYTVQYHDVMHIPTGFEEVVSGISIPNSPKHLAEKQFLKTTPGNKTTQERRPPQ